MAENPHTLHSVRHFHQTIKAFLGISRRGGAFSENTLQLQSWALVISLVQRVVFHTKTTSGQL